MADLFNELLDSLDSLTDDQVMELMSRLEVKRSGIQKVAQEKSQEEIGVPMACPKCGCIGVKKHGFKNGKQRYYCNGCKKTFTKTVGSLKHYSHLSAGQWRGLLLGMVQNLSNSKIADHINTSVPTVWYNRQKVCKALQELFGEQDTFTDIAECDEYYTPVSFKGKRDPKFFIYTLRRMPRHHRTRQQKLEYLRKAGLLDSLQKNPEYLEMLLSTSDSYKRGISNEQTCILTCKDRSGNLTINPVCVGRLETADLTKTLGGKFASDAIMVTDSHNAYPAFAKGERIQLEQIESGKHAKGAYNLGRINALHADISRFYPEQAQRAPATKYLDLSLMLFWWLTKNSELNTEEKVDKLERLISDKLNINGMDYETITNRELTINTKGEFPTKV